MANRHANKGLRRAILARMAKTGESYQRARAHVLRQRQAPARLPAAPVVELVETKVHGRPVVLTIVESPGLGSYVVLREPSTGAVYRPLWRKGWPA